MIQKYLSLILFFGCFAFAFGQSIFSNDITGPNPSDFNPYFNNQIVNTNIFSDGIRRGNGALPNTGTNRYNARSWNTPVQDFSAYFEFEMTPDPGFEIDFISFVYTGQVSPQGPTNIDIRSSLDNYTSSIGTPTLTGSTIDLSGAQFQNITSSISFRIYAWNAPLATGTFSINDFTFNGNVILPTCTSTTVWDGNSWDNGNPTITTEAVLNGDFDTDVTINGSITACSLTISSGFTLTVSNDTFIEVQNDIVANGDINVATSGSVVQVDDSGSVSGSGTITVTKETAEMNNWYEYTYWSSPTANTTIDNGLIEATANRRFLFNAQNYLDALTENENDGNLVDGQDDIDDDGNAWTLVSGSDIMTPGVGYASTHRSDLFFGPPGNNPPYQFDYTFEGLFNNGVITVPVYKNDTELDDINWNFIGNPYPSAIDVDAFFSENSYLENPASGLLDGAVYFWSQNTQPSSDINGNENLNFAQSDYAIINNTGETAGGDEIEPTRHIPSGQGFFVSYSDDASGTSGNVVFNNSMRVANNNDLFFRNNSEPNPLQNKLWVDLVSDNGIFNQILVGYVDGATDAFDGFGYDAPKNLSTEAYSVIYSQIENDNDKYAIQGKNVNSLNETEIIPIGFYTSITEPTIYTISLSNFEGIFMTDNDIYLKDNLLNTIHDLKVSDYNFTSEVGEFNNRFEIIFNAEVLSSNENEIKSNQLTIVELANGKVEISLSHNNITIENVEVLDMAGRQIYNVKANSSSEVFDFSNLSQSTYIARIALSNGQVISKKAIKQN